MKLYAFLSGPFPRRVLAYMALKGITEIEVIPVDIFKGESRTPEFLKINPAGSVPVLVLEDGRCIHESLAIVEYLEDMFPENSMSGLNEAERRLIDFQISMINEFYYHCYTSSANLSPYLCNYVVQSHDIDMVTGPSWRMRMEVISEAMGGRKFLAGDKPTIADCMLFPVLEYIREIYDIFIPPHLRPLKEWYKRCAELPDIPLLEISETYLDSMIELAGERI